MRAKQAVPARARQARALKVHRIDGVRHWRKSIDQYIWLLLRAGVPATQISDAIHRSLKKHRKVVALVMPSPEVLEYPRILTHWQTQPEYLNDQGRVRSLRRAGLGATFENLVRHALPGTDATDVLRVLSQLGLVEVSPAGRIKMLSRAFLPQGQQPEQFLAYSLSTLEGILDTCQLNLLDGDSKKCIGRLQRLALAERFHMSCLPAFHEFLNKKAAAFPAETDAWLKEHEIKTPGGRNQHVGYVGVGIHGFAARQF